MSTTTDLNTLTINYLTEAQYEAAVQGGTIDPDALYLTPTNGSGVDDVEVDGVSVVTAGVASIDLTGKSDVGHTHTKSAITDFSHTHTKSEISDFPSLATVATSGSYSDLSNKPSIPTITDTYSGTSSDGMSGKAVKSAIDALDGTISGSAGSGKTLTAFSQTDGKVSATFGNISITKSQVSDFPSIPTITDTYSGTSSDGMSGKAVKSAIDALDGTVSGSAGASKTLTAFSQTDGKVSATFGNISITKSQVSDFPSLATVATSGSYTDLTDKPTIPTVNNATLTIQKNGTNVSTFTANASSNVTCNISVPTDTSDLTNSAGFITSSDIPVTDVTANGTSVLDGSVAKFYDFTGTDGNDDGTAGLVPAPEATDTGKYLKSDGTWATVSGGGGTTYTATSPIDITSDVISHESSGVTAGTYVSTIPSKTSYATFPTITVDANGHITSASNSGLSIYSVNQSSADLNVAFIGQYAWATALRNYGQCTLSAGSTSATTTISSDTLSGYTYKSLFRVADVRAYDASTYEPIIVDWTVDKLYSAGSSITLTVSIAEAHTNNILYFPILTCGSSM